MIFERRVGGLIRYRKIFFPTSEAALQISRSVLLTEVVRLFGVFGDLGVPPNVVRHRQLLTVWVDLSVGLDRVWGGMKRKSCRYEIHRAEKMLSRVTIEINSPKAMKDFLSVYNHFAETKGPVPRLSAPKLSQYSANGELLMAYLDDRPLCGHLLLCDRSAGIARLLYSGSRRLESAEDAAACGALNRYLHWYEMQRYHAQGFVTYDLGGIRTQLHPTAQFKLSLGGTIVTEHTYLLSGSRQIAKLGNFLYEKFLEESPNVSKVDFPNRLMDANGPG